MPIRIRAVTAYTVQIVEPWVLNLERASGDVVPEIDSQYGTDIRQGQRTRLRYPSRW